jgi:tRNA(Ile)-lysidine synthase
VVTLALPIPADPIRVGFSGGADSTALLLALQQAGADIEALHFHHGIRGVEADADAAWCARFCELRNIRFRCVHLAVPAQRRPRESVEMAARRLRLDWYAKHAPPSTIALAHHQDDLIETFFLRLMRGANASGLCGLRSEHRIGGLRILRPLLHIPRADILAWLAEQGIQDHRHDSSNDDLSIPRNRVRATLLPDIDRFPGGRAGILRSIEFLGQDAAILEVEAEVALEGIGPDLPIPLLLAADFARWPRLLSAWLGRPVAAGTLRNLYAGLQREAAEHAAFAIDADLRLRVERGHLTFAESARAPDFEYEWDWQAHPSLELPEIRMILRADGSEGERFADLPCPLVLRSRRPGDQMVPFGRRSPVRLKKLIQAAKLSPEAKARLCVVADPAGRILWVPGVRRAASGAVQPGQAFTRIACQPQG